MKKSLFLLCAFLVYAPFSYASYRQCGLVQHINKLAIESYSLFCNNEPTISFKKKNEIEKIISSENFIRIPFGSVTFLTTDPSWINSEIYCLAHDQQSVAYNSPKITTANCTDGTQLTMLTAKKLSALERYGLDPASEVRLQNLTLPNGYSRSFGLSIFKSELISQPSR